MCLCRFYDIMRKSFCKTFCKKEKLCTFFFANRIDFLKILLERENDLTLLCLKEKLQKNQTSVPLDCGAHQVCRTLLSGFRKYGAFRLDFTYAQRQDAWNCWFTKGLCKFDGRVECGSRITRTTPTEPYGFGSARFVESLILFRLYLVGKDHGMGELLPDRGTLREAQGSRTKSVRQRTTSGEIPFVKRFVPRLAEGYRAELVGFAVCGSHTRQRSTCKVANFFFATFFFLGKKKVDPYPCKRGSEK